MIRCALLIWVLWAATATADSWPALYDVSGVAGDDTLNVRAGPNGAAEILGTLAPDAQNIEVIRINDTRTWGLVNLGEQSGWASLRYLTRQPGQAEGDIPVITRCFGTEPFWSFRMHRPDYGEWAVVSGVAPISVGPGVRASGRLDTFAFFGRFGPNAPIRGTDRFSFTLRRQACNDGMSDRDFGIAIDFLAHPASGLTPLGGQSLLTGCCTIAP